MTLHLEPEQASMRPRLVYAKGRFWWQIGADESLREVCDDATAEAVICEAEVASAASGKGGPISAAHFGPTVSAIDGKVTIRAYYFTPTNREMAEYLEYRIEPRHALLLIEGLASALSAHHEEG